MAVLVVEVMITIEKWPRDSLGILTAKIPGDDGVYCFISNTHRDCFVLWCSFATYSSELWELNWGLRLIVL